MSLCAATPMWTGWNSLVTDDPLPRQKIGYMDNISLPPTRLDVVAETLKQSQRVASECGDQYVVVHYDLAVAKPAMQIQAAESPLYDNIFICFGPFHILLAYFGCLGHILDGSGGPEILTETDVLAAGSLNGFLTGKHYNRCKRLHPLLATAFQVLHYKRFLEVTGPLSERLKEGVEKLAEEPSAELLGAVESLEDYVTMMDMYMDYRKRTLNGENGNTARFWMMYVSLVDIFLRFNRACRTNDLDLFVYSLGEMCPLFFAANRPNYARWMVRYFHNLLNIDNSHPGVRETLAEGALSIRRTDKAFSRTAVDMTLEQTVNADAASRTTGITAFSNSESARRRWMVTRSARSAIIGSLLEKAGLKSVEDVTKEVRPHRVKKDHSDLEKLLDGIESTMNPFTQPPDESLYCLSTGKQVRDDIRDDLLQCVEKGETWRQEFTTGCFADPSRFEKPIKRRKVLNFASGAIKSKVTIKDQKLVQLQCTRDLFGRLLYISTMEQIDLAKVFSYPLVPVPLSLAHIDGSMNKTDKAKLMHKLEAIAECDTKPASVDITLVDAGFILHTLQNVPQTFGDISSMLLRQLCTMSTRVDFICDTYTVPSIKEAERFRRGGVGDELSYQVTGADQKRPKDWQNALNSPSFKTSFLRFLVIDWQNDVYTDVLRGHEVYLAQDRTCHRFTEDGGSVKCELVPQMVSKHEEADTRLIYHLVNAYDPESDKTISVRSNDTDVMVLLLYHVSKLPSSASTVWMDAGLSGNNTRRFINIPNLLEHIEPSVVDALPSLHAFTVSDYTAAFMNKGKSKPLDLIMKSKAHSDAFSMLGENTTVDGNTASLIESFVCTLYGRPKMTKVNYVRYDMFHQKCAPKDTSNPLEEMKGINPSSLPPCQNVLRHKIMRTNYVAAMWKGASKQIPTTYSPEQHGWELQDRTYKIKWFDGDQVPRSICEVLQDDSLRDDDEDGEIDFANIYDSDESDDDDRIG